MRINNEYYICAFDTKNEAVYLYYTLDRKGHKNFQLISTPCFIQAGCGYSIRFSNIAYLDALIEEAEKVGIYIERIYFLKRENGKRVVKKIII